MPPSFQKISNSLVHIKGTDPIWSTSCYGNTILGNASTRPIIVRNGTCTFASIDYPIYGDNLAYNFATKAELQVQKESDTPGPHPPGAVMTGKVKVRECFFRESTGERSWAGAESAEIDFGNNPDRLMVRSNAWAYHEQGTITHRIFYVCYTELLGVYYEAARIPYTSDTADNYDEVTINVSPTAIINNRPLEDQMQTRIFPAVKTGTFWKGRVWGGGLKPRDFAEGTELKFYSGQNYVDILETEPSSGVYPDKFTPADNYKGIVDRDTNMIVAYIDRVIHGTRAIIRMPNDVAERSNWPDSDTVFDNVGLSGDLANIYSTPIYAGGAGGAIVYGIMTWNPLDTLQDEGFYASGSQITKITTAGDDLCVIYDKGIGFYTGDVSAGAPPTCRSYVAAKDVGTFNPDSVWQTSNGDVWFQGSGRIYVIRNGSVVDASAQSGVADFWSKFTQPYGDGQRRYQTAFNPQTQIALMVNVPKKGEGTSTYGNFGVALAHDLGTLHPVRFQDFKFSSIVCCRHDNGDWQFYGGTKDGSIFKLLVKGQKSDVGEAIESPVSWTYTTGTFWANGSVYTAAVRFVIETDATEGVELTVEADAKAGNLHSGKFNADVTRVVPHQQLDRLEWIDINKGGGFAMQYRISGTTATDFKLIAMMAKENVQPSRGFSQ